MSLSTVLLVVAVWTVIACFAGLLIAKVLRRRSEEAQVPRSENFRNSARVRPEKSFPSLHP